MKQDKALLEYNGQAQWQVVYQLLYPFSDRVVISLNPSQAEEWKLDNKYNLVVDNPAFQNHGPLTGLLSVSEAYPNTAVFLLACDYPLLRIEHLKYLDEHRSSEYDVVCFQIGGQPEPLISIFEVPAMRKINHFFQAGNDSIRQFIQSASAKMVVCNDSVALTNVNTEEEYQQFQTRIQ